MVDRRPGVWGWRTVDGFEIVRELGRGSSSVVELAWQRSLERLVALKRLMRVWHDDPGATARLRREAQVISRLSDPRVVTLYDLAVEGDEVLLVMEYVRGPTVRSLFATTSPTPSQALAVISDVAGALDCAARIGVVHRDVKPANVFVTSGGRCKLGDFGLARISAERDLFLSQDGVRRGTPLYMAPEQLRGVELTPACDVYALALLAWELLAGAHPLAGLPVSDVVAAHLRGDAAAADAPSVPRPVADVLRAALAPVPGDRPGAAELAEDLQHRAPAHWFDGRRDSPLEAHRPASDVGLGVWHSEAGWSRAQVAEFTWTGPEDEPVPAGRSFAPDQAPEAVPEIDDSWLQPVEHRAPALHGRRLRRWGVVAGAFLVGFAAVVVTLTLLGGH